MPGETEAKISVLARLDDDNVGTYINFINCFRCIRLQLNSSIDCGLSIVPQTTQINN